jgi:gamma-glutamyltranspeptidase/glutathione hydrolase
LSLGVRLIAFTPLLALPSGIGAQAMMRPDVMGREAAVVSDHALASAAGAAALRRGGNAVDAAITMAAVLTVVRPHMNGVGGDNFLLIRDARTRQVHALNGSGGAGSRATPAFFAERSLRQVPGTGIHSVSVPGAVRAWEDALKRFGTISLAEALAPAIAHAEGGFAVSTRLSLDIAGEERKIRADPSLAMTFLPGGSLPRPGTILVLRDLAATLRAIARDGADAMYAGTVGQRIASFMSGEDGLLVHDDLVRHRSEWLDPIATTYGGKTMLAFPPNSQGMAFLELLNLAELAAPDALARNSTAYIHALAEASAIAYADRDAHLADPRFSPVPVDRLISKPYAREVATRIRADSVAMPPGEETVRDGNGDTIFLAVVDKDGNAVSMIQSLYASFGSGRMVPGTGVVLHNRGALFELTPGHPNLIAPGKRPFHTLTPAMALNADRSLAMVFGTPGGDGQPQTLLQVVNNVLRFGMTPQQAVEAPRWRRYAGGRLGVEPGVADSTVSGLRALGHQVRVQEPSAEFGGAQMILITAGGVRMTGADPRREAYAIAW